MSHNINKIQFKIQDLYKGCMLAAIAHAIMTACYPEGANEHSWDEMNYSVQDSAGTRGTITFCDNYCVGAFRDDSIRPIEDIEEYFKYAPDTLKNLAKEEALQYLLDDVNGKTAPSITTAFWAMNDEFFSIDEFDEFMEKGGFLLENHIMSLDDAIEAWKEYYDMTEEQCNLLKKLYDKKIKYPSQKLVLTKEEMEAINSNDEEGMEESEISFNEIGIYWSK